MNKFRFGAIYNRRLWEKELGVSARIQNDFSHGNRFPCQKVYIHGYRASSINVLYTRQLYLIRKCLFTRLTCVKYQNAIHTAVVFHIHSCRSSSIKVLFTRQQFSMQNVLSAVPSAPNSLLKKKNINARIACFFESN